jgi:hypothetical protein
MAAAALIRGPRGGIGLSRGSDCASARPNQASATNEQTILVHIQIADFIGHLVSFGFRASYGLGPDIESFSSLFRIDLYFESRIVRNYGEIKRTHVAEEACPRYRCTSTTMLRMVRVCRAIPTA